MEAISMKSPVLTRVTKGPNFCVLTRARIITEDDLESSQKWNIIKQWYEAVEKDPNHEWIHKALQSMINAVLYQERIYFAVTREKLTELFQRDKNWSKGISLSPKNYAYLINEMVDSGLFEAHPENNRLKNQRKPMIFKLVDKMVLDLMKPSSEVEQEMQVLNFVENYTEEDTGNNVGNNVGNTERKKDRKEESKPSFADSSEIKNNNKEIDFDQLLLVQLNGKVLPKFSDLEELAKIVVTNCSDYDAVLVNTRKFERHLKNILNNKPSNGQKKLIRQLTESFGSKLEKYATLEEMSEKNIKLKEPKELESKAINLALKKSLNEEDKVQSDTVKILNATFGRETIRVLKSKLSKTEDPKKRFKIEKEIELWESMM